MRQWQKLTAPASAGPARIAAGLAAATLALASCGEPETGASSQPPRVRTAPLSQLQTTIEYSAPAQALSRQDSVLAAELNTTVRRIAADVGADVEAGQTLIELDCRDARDALEQAEATLDSLQARETLARRQLERARSLRAGDSISEEDLNRRETELDAARAERRAQAAQREQARRNVARCTVSAPFTGAVTRRHVQTGEHVAPGTPLVRLVNTESLEVQAQVAADEADHLNADARPAFVAGSRRYPLQVRAIANAVDPRTLTQAARLDFAGDTPKPGTMGSLVWTDPRPALAPHLISERGGRSGVLVAGDSKARFHPLPDALPGRPAFVDLPPQTPVITDGRRGLDDGDPITAGGTQ